VKNETGIQIRISRLASLVHEVDSTLPPVLARDSAHEQYGSGEHPLPTLLEKNPFVGCFLVSVASAAGRSIGSTNGRLTYVKRLPITFLPFPKASHDSQIVVVLGFRSKVMDIHVITAMAPPEQPKLKR
jgi:hypothetical protein